jgi:hypothetical protein
MESRIYLRFLAPVNTSFACCAYFLKRHANSVPTTPQRYGLWVQADLYIYNNATFGTSASFDRRHRAANIRDLCIPLDFSYPSDVDQHPLTAWRAQ